MKMIVGPEEEGSVEKRESSKRRRKRRSAEERAEREGREEGVHSDLKRELRVLEGLPVDRCERRLELDQIC